ncbi:hypothetical protein [Paraburkholderia kirstenboschensis]|uniref:hypothetical protein n=1 Tax=Paraburkholderia kirstenboschensis TaxID=1245436 RepID=UPI000A72C727|nr:hypothetical protein [Paraburkholderia kirstenboschensis]
MSVVGASANAIESKLLVRRTLDERFWPLFRDAVLAADPDVQANDLETALKPLVNTTACGTSIRASVI